MPRNARKDKRNRDVNFQFTNYDPSTFFPSPPAHLPTPLPESNTPEERLAVLAPAPLVASTVLDHLIDFQQPQEESAKYSYPIDFYDDEMDLSPHHRSPPFIEAQLPSGEHVRSETPPLPIPPRIDAHYHDEDESENVPHVTSAGHTRSPTLPRSPGRFESISRTIKTYAPPASTIKSSATAVLKSSADTIRNYVPSSVHIPIPSGSPSPPLVSRPLSFGQFSVDSDLSRQPFSPPTNAHTQYETNRPSGVSRVLTNDALATYPRTGDARVDTITWAHWDTLSQRCTLIIGYTTGIQIWDCHDLGSVTEVLNLRLTSEDWTLDFMDRRISFTNFVHAAILPSPAIRSIHANDGDPMEAHRPLLGILMTSADGHSALFIYSLSSHQIIKRLPLPGIALTFQSNNHFIIISTVSPVALYIFSPTTFHTIWTISSEMLSSFSPSPGLFSNVTLNSPVDNTQSSETPCPVFALSYRLLAYASPQPTQPSRLSMPSTISSNSVPNHSSTPFRLTQTDFGQAAMKLGGSVLGGMKVLGGLAFEAAKGHVTDGVTNRGGGGSNRFFSRSAPTDERSFSFSPLDEEKVVIPDTNVAVEAGSYVTILDLMPLLDGTGTQPVKVAEFRASRTQSIAQLRFTVDGCRLIIVPENGQVIRMYTLRPMPNVNRPWLKSADPKHRLDQVSRMYDLRRGRTSVSVDDVACSRDGRWLVIGSQNRTLHVFATNPYGGNPNIPSHLEGRVKNTIELVSGKVEITPLVRLRPMQHPKPVQLKVPLAFSFIHPGGVHLPSSLLPPISGAFKQDSASSPPISPRRALPVTTFQDILLFDPMDGVLSLRRVLIEQKPESQMTLPILSSSLSKSSPGGISRSLPGGVGGPARLGTSPSAGSSISRTSSSSTGAGGPNPSADVSMELAGKVIVVATWNLQRTADWEELRKRLHHYSNESKHSGRKSRTNWLAEAELSPCSRSPRVLPRSIYLSHQFGFWTLGEDYHALLRQYHFDIHGNKLQVRKEVQISLGIGLNHTNDRFVDDLNSLDGFRSSVDEPLADALANDMSNYTHAIPPILPMYPNGISGAHSMVSKPSAFIRNSIPIKKLGDGVSEGLGRIRKEISYSYNNRRMYSPSLGPKADADGDNVPLEFDEEEEDFLGVTRGRAIGTSDGSVESGTTIPTPASEGGEPWGGWESRDIKTTVEEMERFDDISVVGFLDEEHQQESDARRRAEMIKNQRGETKQSQYFGM